jgi:hypothetical protein
LSDTYRKILLKTTIGQAKITKITLDPEDEAAREGINRQNKTNKQNYPLTFAASSATEDEEKIAKLGKHPDGSIPVTVPKRIWRPQVKSVYLETPTALDPSENLDWLFQEHGETAITNTNTLPPRDDIIEYDPARYSQEFNANIQWRDCPPEHQAVIESIIKQYWDVFCQDGMQKHIRGFQYSIDTGTSAPICCKPPRYGPHESRVIDTLTKALEGKQLIEDDHGPYGALIVLASKPHQKHVHWVDFIFRLCNSFRPINAKTRPFTFPVTRCDDAVEGIGDREFTMTLDLDSGYWQVKLHNDSKEKTAFFTPEGKNIGTSCPWASRTPTHSSWQW